MILYLSRNSASLKDAPNVDVYLQRPCSRSRSVGIALESSYNLPFAAAESARPAEGDKKKVPQHGTEKSLMIVEKLDPVSS